MKKLIFIFILLPLIAIGETVNEDKTLADFEKLCANSHDKDLHDVYCKLANDHRRALKIIKVES